jgi:hypothetical protein
MIARATFEAESKERTRLTFNVDIPSMDDSMGSMLTSAIQKSLQNIKHLIESEVNK